MGKFWGFVLIALILAFIYWLRNDGAWLAELIFDQNTENVPVPEIPIPGN
mgnify:CR=1 FL=1